MRRDAIKRVEKFKGELEPARTAHNTQSLPETPAAFRPEMRPTTSHWIFRLVKEGNLRIVRWDTPPSGAQDGATTQHQR